MSEVTALALSFPGVVYTAFVGVVIVYWAFVIVGAIELHGSDGALDGLGDGAGGHDLGDGFDHHGADGGDADGGGDGDADGGDADDLDSGHVHGPLAALMSALRLRSVPITVMLSVLVVLSWLLAMISMQLVVRDAPALRSVLSWCTLFAAPLVALPLTSLLIRPLTPVFAHRHAPSRSDFLGKTCVVRTGEVTQDFGEAVLEDGGAGLVVRVRIDGAHRLKRGDHAVLIDWDPARDSFVVEPLKELLGTDRPA